jgi:hypothetical protein
LIIWLGKSDLISNKPKTQMKKAIYCILFALLGAGGCTTKTEPRPLADLNLLTGRWVSADGQYEYEISAAKRNAIFTKVPLNNAFGFKVGEESVRNIEAVDATAYRGETRFRGAAGFYVFADIKYQFNGEELTYTSDVGSTTITVTGQKGTLKRVK